MSEPVIPERPWYCGECQEYIKLEAKIAEQAATIAKLTVLLRDERDPLIIAIGSCQKTLILRCRCVACRRQRIDAALSQQKE